jgi:hypothetical protein|nr:MAG TPA: Protein of unknown function (DUF2681) [Caudoviricetes sp.]
MSFNPSDIYEFVGFLVGLAGLWAFFATRLTNQEQRITRLEMLVEKNREQLDRHNIRLDNHDLDNKIMLALVEKVDALKEDIKEIKDEIKK